MMAALVSIKKILQGKILMFTQKRVKTREYAKSQDAMMS